LLGKVNSIFEIGRDTKRIYISAEISIYGALGDAWSSTSLKI